MIDLPPFRLVPPAAPEIPVVVEVPHAGLWVPAPCAATLAAPARAIARDADLYVDDLYAEAPLEGATLLVSQVSRYVVDLNRSETDVDPDAVVGARNTTRLQHGLVWRATSDGDRALVRPLQRDELEERLETIYRPYHRALRDELERKRTRFGIAILLAAHSMPSAGRPGARGEPGIMRADIVPGTRGHSSADARFITAVERLAIARGLTLRHDDPYAGGYATQAHGLPSLGFHAIQIELARRLYMDEATLRKKDTFAWASGLCRALVHALGQAVKA